MPIGSSGGIEISGASDVLPPVTSVLSAAPLVPSLTTVSEMLTAVLPGASELAPSTSLVPSASALTTEDITGAFDDIELDAVTESRLLIDSSEESHASEADAPTSEKVLVLILLWWG